MKGGSRKPGRNQPWSLACSWSQKRKPQFICHPQSEAGWKKTAPKSQKGRDREEARRGVRAGLTQSRSYLQTGAAAVLQPLLKVGFAPWNVVAFVPAGFLLWEG